MNMYKIKDHPNLSFKLINRVTGWVTFVIASMTYILTAESTASLWDCGEFITTSVGLQVGHPPGAPLFMIISRLFAIFAPSADTQAYMINCMSAICSGLTILFLFWSITHLARKLIVKEGEEMTMGQMFAILGASLIGSLTYTFTDTFWFSAVEGEVYAMSSLFTAVVFWAILKWENVAFERYANRWLILIAYLIGLSIGVHLLNLLAIPAIVFVYYFKKYTPTVRGFIKTGILSVFILGVVNFGIIPGVIKVAGWFELTFVNGMGLLSDRSDHLCITDYRGFSLGYPLYAEKRDACLEYHPDLFYGDSDRLFFLFDDRYPFIKRSSYRRRKP